MSRLWWCVMGWGLAACSSRQVIEVSGDPCDLVDEDAVCPLCLTGYVTCRYEDVSVTTPSCRTCQTEVWLYERLCDEGVPELSGEVVCVLPGG